MRFLLVFFLLYLAHGFAGEKTNSCQTCHADIYQAWATSHHALAMQPATSKTVLGNFNDAKFTAFNVTSRFHQKNGKFYIYSQGADGKYADFEVEYTFGIDPLQQYLVKTENGRLQSFTIAWDTFHQRWISMYPNENIKPDNPLHWTARAYNWNYYCADCHSTNVKKNYDAQTKTYHTTFSAVNIDCDACHGSSTKHLEWARAQKKSSDNGFSKDQKMLQNKNVVEICASCHSRRHPISPNNITSGEPILQNYEPEVLRENIYFPDGGLQEEDYEYGSFLQSKMYLSGVTCLNCHDPHSLQLKLPGNGVCLQCHNPNPPREKFPGLQAKNYDSPAHHFHPIHSEGSQCISCHMPSRTYMQVHVRHDHYFRIPRPDLSVKYGIPNACNTCHQDKSAQWAADQIKKWYKNPNLSESNADIFAQARLALPEAEKPLIALSSDEKKSPIVRASAVALLGHYHSQASLDALIHATKDLHPLVRMEAVRSLLNAPQTLRMAMVTPLLKDPFRLVRMESAKNLSDVSLEKFSATDKIAFQKALMEYKTSQLAEADQPEALTNLGMLAIEQGDNVSAQKNFQLAMDVDPHFYPASIQLARLDDALGKKEDAIAALKSAIRQNPSQGELYYSIGLLFAEQGDFEASKAVLAQALKLMPTNPRVRQAYAIVLQKTGA